MNFNAEFKTLMKFCLLQGYLRYVLHPGKSHALNDRSDSLPRMLTLLLLTAQLRGLTVLHSTKPN